MAQIAKPLFITERDEEYHTALKDIRLGHLGRFGGIKPEGQKLVKALDERFENVKTTISPLPKDDTLWLDRAKKTSYMSDEQQRKRDAKWLFCLRQNNLAWYNDMPRRSFLKIRYEKNKWQLGELQLTSIGIHGMMAENPIIPSFRTIENWMADFDLPSIDNIDLTSEWHTLEEWVSISCHFKTQDMPKTIHQMRRYVVKLTYSKNRDFCRVIGNKKHYKNIIFI